ncbi:helix-turn-helix domain-containing protein, partial [Actinomadura adrarensis]
MPVDYRAPNINARRLGHYLQQVREALELSYDAAAAQVGCDATWLIRLETGFQRATPEEVGRL